MIIYYCFLAYCFYFCIFIAAIQFFHIVVMMMTILNANGETMKARRM